MNVLSLTQLMSDIPRVTIVHIGASHVPNTREPYEHLVEAGVARVIGFEPNQAELAKLVATAGPNRMFLPHVVGAGGPGLFHETVNPWMASLLAPDMGVMGRFHMLTEFSEVTAVHNVHTKKLDDMAEIDEIDFLKVDVQGAELQVLQGAERLLESCVVVQSEVEFMPLYKNQPLFADVDTYMRSKGFAFHTFQELQGRCYKPLVVHNDPKAPLNQMLWADAVYVPDLARLETMSTPMLKKLALLLHDIYKSFDLCLAVLFELDGRDGKAQDLEGRYLEMLPPELADDLSA